MARFFVIPTKRRIFVFSCTPSSDYWTFVGGDGEKPGCFWPGKHHRKWRDDPKSQMSKRGPCWMNEIICCFRTRIFWWTWPHASCWWMEYLVDFRRIIRQPFPKTNIIQNVSDNMYNIYTQENSRAPSSSIVVLFLR